MHVNNNQWKIWISIDSLFFLFFKKYLTKYSFCTDPHSIIIYYLCRLYFCSRALSVTYIESCANVTIVDSAMADTDIYTCVCLYLCSNVPIGFIKIHYRQLKKWKTRIICVFLNAWSSSYILSVIQMVMMFILRNRINTIIHSCIRIQDKHTINTFKALKFFLHFVSWYTTNLHTMLKIIKIFTHLRTCAWILSC